MHRCGPKESFFWPLLPDPAWGGFEFRNEIVTGVGGKQILVEDPSGNPIELFQPILPEARLKQTQ